MEDTGRNQKSGISWHKVVLFLAIGLAALSSMIKELNQVRLLTIEAGQMISEWTNALVPTASARTVVSCRYISQAQTSSRSDEFRWNGRLSPGQTIEIQGTNGGVVAEPSNTGEVQVVAIKRARRGDVNTVEVRVVPHAGGVTICAVYPAEEGGMTPCDPAGSEKPNNSTRTVRNNDVSVDFSVRVPPQVGFVGRTVNGEISATGLSSNVSLKTVNGSIKISTSGYAEASTINGEISAKIGDANWPNTLAFKTLNGGIDLDLPAVLSTDVKAETLNGEINSDFPMTLSGMKDRKKLDGKIGAGGRELLLKTLNGSINLKRAM
ncbi:MAG TPA: DUF4097 family beta strand repeat-containing protein [Pyrinomonadaceae bacterium]|nr:DUF4097 family beta strand repeat-containing protein [Pyrinomonadaceae bacterium]